MKNDKWIILLCFLLTLTGCATAKEGVPTGQTFQCPEGPRQMMDCRMAFEQYKRVLKFDLNVIQNFGTGVGVGAQPLINLDSITGDLMAHQYQVCLEYNNCMISAKEYVAEQRYLRRAQLKIREMANTARVGIGMDSSMAPSVGPPSSMPPPTPQSQSMGQMGDQGMRPDIGVDQKMAEAQNVPAPDSTGGTETASTPVIFEQLSNLETKMRTLIQQRGVGVSITPTSPPTPAPADLKPAQKVNIEYSLKARRPKTLPVTKNTEYKAIKFTQGTTLKTGDQFRVNFKTDNDGYVYVINFDGSGKSQIIFPHPEAGATNFVKGGQTYEIPASVANWYYLDEVTGKETLYVIASPFKIANLDALVTDLQQGKGGGAQVTLKNARLRGSLEALTRGVGVMPGDAPEEKSSTSSLISNERIEFNHQ